MPKYKFSYGGKNYALQANSPAEAGPMVEDAISHLKTMNPTAGTEGQLPTSQELAESPTQRATREVQEAKAGIGKAVSGPLAVGGIGIPLAEAAATGGMSAIPPVAGALAKGLLGAGAIDLTLKGSGITEGINKAAQGVRGVTEPLASKFSEALGLKYPFTLGPAALAEIPPTAMEAVPTALSALAGGKASGSKLIGKGEAALPVPKGQEAAQVIDLLSQHYGTPEAPKMPATILPSVAGITPQVTTEALGPLQGLLGRRGQTQPELDSGALNTLLQQGKGKLGAIQAQAQQAADLAAKNSDINAKIPAIIQMAKQEALGREGVPPITEPSPFTGQVQYNEKAAPASLRSAIKMAQADNPQTVEGANYLAKKFSKKAASMRDSQLKTGVGSQEDAANLEKFSGSIKDAIRSALPEAENNNLAQANANYGGYREIQDMLLASSKSGELDPGTFGTLWRNMPASQKADVFKPEQIKAWDDLTKQGNEDMLSKTIGFISDRGRAILGMKPAGERFNLPSGSPLPTDTRLGAGAAYAGLKGLLQ